MIEDTDLLPWILGGMLALAAAAAAALSDPAAAPSAPVLAAASTAPASVSAPPAAHPATQVDLSPVIVAPTARQQLPPGQVWECDVDGRRVFSDTQCGAHATVRRITELNVIESSNARVPPRPYAGSYPPSGPGYDGEPGPASETPADDADTGYPIYTGTVVVRDRWRRDHSAHRANHARPRAARP